MWLFIQTVTFLSTWRLPQTTTRQFMRLTMKPMDKHFLPQQGGSFLSFEQPIKPQRRCAYFSGMPVVVTLHGVFWPQRHDDTPSRAWRDITDRFNLCPSGNDATTNLYRLRQCLNLVDLSQTYPHVWRTVDCCCFLASSSTVRLVCRLTVFWGKGTSSKKWNIKNQNWCFSSRLAWMMPANLKPLSICAIEVNLVLSKTKPVLVAP